MGVSTVALTAGLGSSQALAQGTVLDPITVVASKTEERVINALAGVSAVRGDTIDQLMPTRTSDVFFGMPSVGFQQRADDPGTAINIRGLQDFGRVAVVIDGARQNFQRTGHQADGLFYLEPELLAAVDVVRGPVANIYGSGAIGGVVSFRTKDVEDVLRPGERYGVLTHGMLGSNTQQMLGSAFGAVRFGPNADMMIGGTARERSDYRDGDGNLVPNSAFDVKTAIGKLNLRPADGHEVKFGGITYEANFRNGLPNATNTATVYATQAQNHIATGRWRYQRPEDRLFDFDGNVYWTETGVKQTKVAGINGSPSSGFLGDRRTFNIDTTGFDVHNTSRFDWGAFRNALTVGGDLFQDKVKVNDPSGTGDLFTPNGERTVSGTFAQLKANYSTWLEFIGAARYDNYDLQGGGANSGGDRVSPKGTVGITPLSWFTVYGTYAEGYRAPAVTEVFVLGQHPNVGPGSNFDFLQNTALKPEIGKNKEIGINIRHDGLFVAGDALRIKANAFENNIDDFIEQAVIGFGQPAVGGAICRSPAGFCIQYQNIEKARIRGVELEGTYDAGGWFVGLAGSTLNGRNLTADEPLLKIPPRQLATTFGVRFFERKAQFVVRWLAVDSKDRDDIPASANIPPVPAYNLVNIYAEYKPTEDVLLGFGVENLFDVQYARYLDVTTRGSAVVPSPSPGLTVKGSLKVRFGETFLKG